MVGGLSITHWKSEDAGDYGYGIFVDSRLTWMSKSPLDAPTGRTKSFLAASISNDFLILVDRLWPAAGFCGFGVWIRSMLDWKNIPPPNHISIHGSKTDNL